MSGISGKVVPGGVSVVVGANGKLGTRRFLQALQGRDQTDGQGE